MLGIYHIGAKQLKTVMKDKTVFSKYFETSFIVVSISYKCFHAGSHVVSIVDNAHNVTVDRISKAEMTN